MSTPDPGLTAALLKISEFAERLALAEATMGGLIDGVADLRELVEEHQKLLEKTSRVIAKLMPPDKPDGPDEPPPYVIQPSVHWWSVDADDRERPSSHLRSWVDDVYRPHYGHLAVMLAPCWADHELCLVNLDWLSRAALSACISTSGRSRSWRLRPSTTPGSCPLPPSYSAPRPPSAPIGTPPRTAAAGEVRSHDRESVRACSLATRTAQTNTKTKPPGP